MLRAAAGISFGAQGVGCLRSAHPLGVGEIAVGLLEVVSGSALLLGVLTPVSGAVAWVTGACAALSLLPCMLSGLEDAWLAALYLLVIVAAVVLLGPGAFSVDARLFGRREISIPSRPPDA